MEFILFRQEIHEELGFAIGMSDIASSRSVDLISVDLDWRFLAVVICSLLIACEESVWLELLCLRILLSV